MSLVQGQPFALTKREQRLSALSEAEVYQEPDTGNGWVLNLPANRQLAGDVIMMRRNPHFEVAGRPSADQRFTHTLTDLHNAGQAVRLHRQSLEGEAAQLRQDVALLNLVREKLDDWNGWSSQDYDLYSSLIEVVASGHVRVLDPAKMRALEQLLGSRRFIDSLGRPNPGAVSWRLPVAVENLNARSQVVQKQFAGNSQRRAWVSQCYGEEMQVVRKLADLASRYDCLGDCESDFLSLAQKIRFKPHVQAVNHAWRTIGQPDSGRVLRHGLLVFGGLYGGIMRPFSIVASTSQAELAQLSTEELEALIGMVVDAGVMLRLIRFGSAYGELASILIANLRNLPANLNERQFARAINAAKEFRYSLRYHGASLQWQEPWYLSKWMKWPPALGEDFDPFARFDG